MEFCRLILDAIDRLQLLSKPVDAREVSLEIGYRDRMKDKAVARELRMMARDGIVVYDRKASGWRRA